MLTALSREGLFYGSHDLGIFGEASDARFLLRGGHEPFFWADEAVSPASERLDVTFRGGAAPHLRVHSRGPEHPLRAGEDGGREQVVAEADGYPRHRVGGRRGYEDQVRPAGQRDVLDATGVLPPALLGVDALPGGYCQGLLRDEAEGGHSGDGLDLVTRLSEATDHPRRLVRRDAARYPDENLRHAGSIQSASRGPKRLSRAIGIGRRVIRKPRLRVESHVRSVAR